MPLWAAEAVRITQSGIEGHEDARHTKINGSEIRRRVIAIVIY